MAVVGQHTSNIIQAFEVKEVARKTFVIDTNVLVHDPAAITKFKQNDVVISLAVLEELNSLKRHGDEVGKNAREVIRYIDSLKTEHSGDLHHGVVIPEGPKIRICLSVKHTPIEKFPLSLDRGSHRLLHTAHSLKALGEN